MKSSTFKLESLQFFNLKFQPVLLLFVSVLLSVLSWSYNITYFFIFFSITPLLLILFDCETRRKDRIFYLFIYELFLRTGLYLPLFINGLPFISYFCVCAFEALIFCLLFLPSALILDIYSNQSNKVFFIFNWLLYEFVQQNWLLGNPIFILGNVLGAEFRIIQWYSYIGAFGGSVWVLIVNVYIYFLITSQINKRRLFIQLLFVLVVPMIFSVYLLNKTKPKEISSKIAVLHTCENQISTIYKQNKSKYMKTCVDSICANLDKSTKILIMPEIFFGSIGSKRESEQLSFKKFYDSDELFDLTLLAGGIVYDNKHGLLNYRNEISRFNTLLIYSSENDTLVFKSKDILVPFIEYLPYKDILEEISDIRFLRDRLGLRLSPTIPLEVGMKDAKTHIKIDSQITILPLLCYEICKSEFVSENLMNSSSNLITLSTYENIYRNEVSISQYNRVVIVRAIETRKSIAKSSNGGISGIITPQGDFAIKTGNCQLAVLKSKIFINREISFYTNLGRNIIKFINIFCAIIVFSFPFYYLLKAWGRIIL